MIVRFTLAAVGLVALFGLASDPAEAVSPPRLHLPSAAAEPVTVEAFADGEIELLRSLEPDELRSVLSVSVGSSEPVPPMLGTVAFDGERLIFEPRFDFLPAQEYRVRLELSGRRIEGGFTLPESRAAATEVLGVTPRVRPVPQNLLRLYVHFSQPMRGGDVYRSISLVDRHGGLVEQAFVETLPELWDRERRRLTLIVHPGRIKRGLEMGERQGPPLEVGGHYRLRVDSAMEDALGRPLEGGFEHPFEVGPADRKSPSVSEWQIGSPVSGSLDALAVDFDEPLDRELLRRLVTVERADRSPWGGRIEIGPEGRTWRFVPRRPWRRGSYVVEVHPALEDLAGNRLDRLFDARVTGSPGVNGSVPIRIGFEVGPGTPRPGAENGS